MCDPQVAYIEGQPGVEFLSRRYECGKTHFTFPLIYIRELG